MDVSRILSEIDAEISRLQQARTALTAIAGTVAVTPPRRGRPPKNSAAPEPKPTVGRRKRNLTPEGRKRIADAMKKRWAERRGSKAGSEK